MAAYVGCSAPQSARKDCFKRLGAMEVQDCLIAPPQTATLARWRQQAPAGFVFSVRAWQLITHDATAPGYQRLPVKRRPAVPTDAGRFRWTATVREAYAETVRCAGALEAAAIVFDTPADFTPTRANRDNMEVFFGQIERPEAVHHVWAPAGVWSPNEVEAICADLGLVPSFDPLTGGRFPAGAHAYFRLGGAAYTESNLQRLADGCSGYDETYYVFSGSNALVHGTRLQSLLRFATDEAVAAGECFT